MALVGSRIVHGIIGELPAAREISPLTPFKITRRKKKIKKKERKKTDNPREGWENGTPPPHRDFKERSVMR